MRTVWLLPLTMLLLVACTPDDGVPAEARPAPSATGATAACTHASAAAMSPTEELAAAGAALASTRLTFSATLSGLGDVNGVADGPGQRMRGTLQIAGSATTVITVGTDYYIRYDVAARADNGKWQHLKLAPGSAMRGAVNLGDPRDPLGSARLLESIVSAERSGACDITGTLDLNSGNVVPFKATLDAAGRLARLGYDLPATGPVPKMRMEIMYSGFGAPQDIAAPPGDIIEAPASVRQVFRS